MWGDYLLALGRHALRHIGIALIGMRTVTFSRLYNSQNTFNFLVITCTIYLYLGYSLSASAIKLVITTSFSIALSVFGAIGGILLIPEFVMLFIFS
jgi:hypothetical protein